MKFKKLNTNWSAAPNAPDPELLVIDGSLQLTFLLNDSRYEHIDAGDQGTIEFYEVYAYRSSSLHDEKKFRERFSYAASQLPQGEFYEIKQSDWQTNFPADKTVVDDAVDKNELSHFIFFVGDQFIECIAGDYMFLYSNQASEKAKEKYPGQHFDHFLAMFTSNFETPDNESFEAYIELYLSWEGVDGFIGLLTELRQIEKNNDLGLFLKVVNEWEMEGFGMEQLKDFVWIIQHFGKEE